jgi:5-methylcytosine-specific restriction endonuclease McrA
MTFSPAILHRTSTLRTYSAMKRTPLRRQSRRHRAGQRQWSRVTAQRIAECGGRCQVAGPGCEGAAREGHHILARSQGGKHEAGNVLVVCGVCHRWIHEHPAEAVARGFLRTRGAA